VPAPAPGRAKPGERPGLAAAALAALFGLVMLFWFATLGALGLWKVIETPAVLAAVNPWYAVAFIAENQRLSFLALGSVVLAITGGEALYADMGHFGRRAIKWAWFAAVFPLLYLNYLGQGALILSNSQAIDNPFFPRQVAGGVGFLYVAAACFSVYYIKANA